MSKVPRRMQVFISSPSQEMARYNDVAKSVVEGFGLREKFHASVHGFKPTRSPEVAEICQAEYAFDHLLRRLPMTLFTYGEPRGRQRCQRELPRVEPET